MHQMVFAMNLVFLGLVTFLPDRFARYFIVILLIWTIITFIEVIENFSIALLGHVILLLFISFIYFYFRTTLFTRPLYVEEQRTRFYKNIIPQSLEQPDKPVVLFLDNDTEMFLGANKLGIQTLGISEEIPNPLLRGKPFTQELYATQYGKRYNKQFDIEFQRDEKILPTTGIRKNDIAYVKEWVKEHPQRRKVLLLDWDRTISVKEGMSFLERKKPRVRSRNIEKYTMFVMGGPERFKYMKDFFSDMHKSNVEIFILTNNGYCTKDTKDEEDPYEKVLFEIYLQIIQCVDPQIDRDHVLCSATTPQSFTFSKKMQYVRKNKGDLTSEKRQKQKQI